MVTVKTFQNPTEASFAQAQLAEAGIEASLTNLEGGALGFEQAIGGFQLQVSAANAERAREVLHQRPQLAPLPDDFVPPPGEPGETEFEVEPPLKPVRKSGALDSALYGGVIALLLSIILRIALVMTGHRAPVTVRGVAVTFLLGAIIGFLVHKSTQGSDK